MPAPRPRDLDVIAPNLKRRLSGVTATVVRLIPIQAQSIAIAATGPGLPGEVPHVALWRIFALPRDRWRVWHARRNTEMLLGLILRHLFRRRLRLLFTSAAQRHHSGYTRGLIRRMDAVIATSAKSASYLERQATVILHGIDLTLFHPEPDRAALRARLGLPEATLVGIVGRIRPQKGTDVFVEAMLSAMRDHPTLHGLVIGRATAQHRDFLAALQDRIAQAGKTANFTFIEELDWPDLLAHYRAMEIFCAPALNEGFGLTPLEAMASGVPAIATPAGAFAEQIVEGETGHIVPAGDATALAAAIARLAADPETRAAMGRAGRAHVEAAFDIRREAAEIIAVYRDLLSR